LHIILVSNRLATAKTLNITPRLLAAAAVGFIVLSFVTSFLFSWVGLRFNLPYASDMVASVLQVQNRKSEEFMRDNVRVMAVKLGEMQAQLMRLDMLGERVSKHTGISLPKTERNARDGQGGPLVNPAVPLSANELQREIDRLAAIVEQRSESLMAIESQLMERRIKTTLLPTIVPIQANHIGSTFGRRVDPIEGVGAMHEGIDFVSDPGTQVIASAGGVVIAAEYHPQYGNMIDIDHGNDFSSRYAHLSKLDVKPGQVIKRGQPIGLSGNTGRSTGPHLHFEVRFKGAAQNPARFLEMGTPMALNSPDAREKNVAPGKLAAFARKSRVTATYGAQR
jgi:murein DD-endopeptidase MepM/ murein hydrolase activator NlpD